MLIAVTDTQFLDATNMEPNSLNITHSTYPLYNQAVKIFMASTENNGFYPPPSHHHHHHKTVIVIVIVAVSLGSLLLLGAAFLWRCLIKKRKKREVGRESEEVDVEGRVKVHEVVIPGPHGTKIKALDVEGDVNVHERIKKEDIQIGYKDSDPVASDIARRAAVEAATGAATSSFTHV